MQPFNQILLAIPLTNFIKVPDKVVVLDLECTAWEGSIERNWSNPDEDPEIIQIGAVILSRENHNWEIGSTFSVYVKPTLQPTLSSYIKSLTGIQQGVIDKYGLDFNAALNHFREFIPTGALLVANGPDWYHLDRNCVINKSTNPFTEKEFVNLRPYFSAMLGLPETDEKLNSYQLYKMLNIAPGTAHDALSDALSVANAIVKLGVL